MEFTTSWRSARSSASALAGVRPRTFCSLMHLLIGESTKLVGATAHGVAPTSDSA